MLVAYFDESGTHSGSLVTAVAGYVSTVPRWKRFEREWTEALREANVDCFHMSEYESRKGVFADWSDKKRVAVIKRLAEIIRKNAAHGVAAAVVVEDYKEVIAQMKETASPYTFCVSRCIVQLTRWAKENHLEGPITYIFEDGADYTGEIEQKKAEISSNTFVKQAFRFYDLKFADKREKIPLQAADIIVYETMKHCKNNNLLDSKRPARKSLMNLLSLRHDGEYFDKNGLIGLAQWLYRVSQEQKQKIPSV